MSEMEDGYLPDFADEVDRRNPWWLIAEKFDVSEALARRIWEDQQEALSAEKEFIAAHVLSEIASEMIRPCKNPRARAFGLMFAAGLDELNGVHSQAEVARELGMTRAAISHWTGYWRNKVRLVVEKFGRNGARESYRTATQAVWDRRKKL